MAKKKVSAVNIAEGIVIAVLILLIGGMLFLYFSFSEAGAAPNILGYTVYHTKAVSMQPEIPAGSAVIAKNNDIENIKVGSVVLCTIGEDKVLTRVVQLVSEDGKMSYVVKFDTAAPDNTFKIPQENIIAKATWFSKGLGSLLTFATSTFGIMLVIIIPSFVIIVFQIIRIINVKRAEEDAYSLDDLDEIMIRDDSDDEDEQLYREPESRYEPEVKPLSFASEDKTELKETLSVNKNGRAELKFSQPSSSPLFTYDKLENSEKAESRPAQGELKFSMNEDAEPAREEAKEPVRQMQEEKPAAETVPFMSNVLPEKLAGAVAEAERPSFRDVRPMREEPKPAPAAEPAPVQPAKSPAVNKPAEAVHTTVKPVKGEKTIRTVKAIPAQASVPKEKLAPPKKQSTSKTISELMSMIDAEESKLK